MRVAADITATIVSIAGALGIGSLLGQWIAGSKDRRQVRANALAALAEVESARWANADDYQTSAKTFTRYVRELQAAALIARLPREVTRTYLALARLGRWLSVDDVEREEIDPEYAGGINADIADIIRDGARLMSDAVWAPAPWRHIRISRRVRDLDTRIKNLGMPSVERRYERARNMTN